MKQSPSELLLNEMRILKKQQEYELLFEVARHLLMRKVDFMYAKMVIQECFNNRKGVHKLSAMRLSWEIELYMKTVPRHEMDFFEIYLKGLKK